MVAEVELDLLIGTLDEERRVRVDDRPHPLAREACGDADHELLADPDVEQPRVIGQLGQADLRRHERDARVVVERARRELVEARSHRAHRVTSATTTLGAWPMPPSARSSAS